VPLLKAGIRHKGFALIDVISPCVTFNDHEGSTKSYVYTRQHQLPIVETDFVPPKEEISISYDEGTTTRIALHDGSTLVLHKLSKDYDPRDRRAAVSFLMEKQASGESPTGLLFVDEGGTEMHDGAKTVDTPLAQLPFEQVCPGNAALQSLQKAYR
jgi:2-oxoglutarate/2-oxoacid ferredoxin oxidoreductase subunit beta